MSCVELLQRSQHNAIAEILSLLFVGLLVLHLGRGGLSGMNALSPGELLSPTCQRYQYVIAAFLRRHPERACLRATKRFSALGEISQTGPKNTGPYQVTR